jgi:hypothetical protein
MYGAETRGLQARRFGNCRIAHVLTLKFVMCKGRDCVRVIFGRSW